MLTAQGVGSGTRPPRLCAGVRVRAQEHTAAERGGHAGSRGAAAGCPSRGLCSQAGPEGKGGVHPKGPGRGCQLPQDCAPWGSSTGSRALSCWLRVSSWVLRPTRQAQGPARAAGPGHQGQAPPRPFRCPENVIFKKMRSPQMGPKTPRQVPPQEPQTEEIKEGR